MISIECKFNWIIFIYYFLIKSIDKRKKQNKRTARGAGKGGSFIAGRRENQEKASVSKFIEW